MRNFVFYTDFEMQNVLKKNGINLYNNSTNEQVDNEKLAKAAIDLGFAWDEKKELWFKKKLNLFEKGRNKK